MKGLYGQFEESRFSYLFIYMTGKQNQYSWSFRSCLENFKYMVCKYSFSLRTANKQHCDLQGTGCGFCSDGLQEKGIQYIWCTQKRQLWGRSSGAGAPE